MKKPLHVDKEDEVLSRITELLIQKGISQRELVEQLGLKKGIYTAWKAGHSKSYLKYLNDIAVYLKVSPMYLLQGGESAMGNNTEEERKLIELYRCLDSESRKRLLIAAETFAILSENPK